MLGRQTASTKPTSNRAKESQSSNPFAALDTESPKPVGAPKWERSMLGSGQIAPAKSTTNAAEEEVDDEEKEKVAIKAKAALREFPSLAEAKTLFISIATLVEYKANAAAAKPTFKKDLVAPVFAATEPVVKKTKSALKREKKARHEASVLAEKEAKIVEAQYKQQHEQRQKEKNKLEQMSAEDIERTHYNHTMSLWGEWELQRKQGLGQEIYWPNRGVPVIPPPMIVKPIRGKPKGKPKAKVGVEEGVLNWID